MPGHHSGSIFQVRFHLREGDLQKLSEFAEAIGYRKRIYTGRTWQNVEKRLAVRYLLEVLIAKNVDRIMRGKMTPEKAMRYLFGKGKKVKK